MSRFPIRVRLTLAFALAMAAVLAAVGAFLYVRLGDSLDEQLNESLQTRADALSAVAEERGGALSAGELAFGDDGEFGQVLRPDGSLVASAPSVAPEPLISELEAGRARQGPLILELDTAPGLGGEPARLLVTSIDVPQGTLVLVVGGSLEDREEALDGLLTQLLVAGPLALLVSSLAGYALAAAALRPVEAMRRQATEISTERLERRLPLPRGRDEIRRLGETLNAMLGRLEAGLARERRFVADAGHELRTPLALLKTELELALRRPRPREELEETLRSAVEEADRLARLAEDLLVLAQLDEGRLPLRRSSLSVEDVLHSVAQRFAARASGEGRGLEVVVAPDVTLVGDRLRLEQALGDLVDNALRHGAGEIRLEARRRGGDTELRVSDEGPGFPPDFLARAFDRFSRAEESRSDGGTGLGLAIVDAIARAHGGQAYVTGGRRGETLVTIRLPAGDREPREAPVTAPL